MLNKKPLVAAVRAAIGTAILAVPTVGYAQNTGGELEEVVVTGTRVSLPGVSSASPIQSIGAQEIAFFQEPEVERILKVMPALAFGDGANVNNGTGGVTTLNLRGLGSNRTLILMNGKRVTPYGAGGVVDVSNIPTALIQRIDVVTGGASAVYGSDAVAGAVNFVLKEDFEGVAIDTNYSETEDYSGDNRNIAVTFGANVADGRGNVVATYNWTDREGVLLGSQALGRLGIGTSDGSGLSAYYDGAGAQAPLAGCDGPNTTSNLAGGSGTTMPTRLSISGVGGSGGQFRNDRTLSSRCSAFNFNPWNYYQTPQERDGGMALGRFEINEHAEAYGSAAFNSTKVRQQIAPSGIFAGTSLWTPMRNPFLGDQARNLLLGQAEAARVAGRLIPELNWRDNTSDGVVGQVDAFDELRLGYARRTPEVGPRSTTFTSDYFQLQGGVRGEIAWDWSYDLSVSYGESDRLSESAGYTNNSAIEQAVRTIDGVNCLNGNPACVPLDVFGGFGTITPEMAGYIGATAFVKDYYEQRIISAVFSGPVEAIKLPWSTNPMGLSFGYENRQERGRVTPDECNKNACLGGGGGNVLPVGGSIKVDELFGELFLPIMEDQPFAEELTFEAGYRVSDYDIVESTDTWKYGVNWRPVDSLLIRAMKQRAVRAPNVGELYAPVVRSLDNATRDPCSSANPSIDATLRDRCIATGMNPADVGVVDNIVAGQINTFSGSDPTALPQSEESDSKTIGLVWTPEMPEIMTGLTISVDYYDIDVDGFIGSLTPQEVLDGCYGEGITSLCDRVKRVFGDLVSDGSGIELFTTNLQYLNAEGIEFAFSTGVSLGDWGTLSFSGNANYYLTQESLNSPSTPVLDCLGRYGTSCGAPLPWVRFVQRTTWQYDDFTVSAQWRHFGEVQIENAQATYQPNKFAGTFPKFQEIDAYNYLDLYASYNYRDMATVSFGIDNVLAKHAPVVGNSAATTASNSGNTFPSQYDTLGRVYKMGVDIRF